MTHPCPTEWKSAFASRRAAQAQMKLGRHGTLKHRQLRPYLCPCGYWHVTSMTKREAKTVQRRKAAA